MMTYAIKRPLCIAAMERLIAIARQREQVVYKFCLKSFKTLHLATTTPKVHVVFGREL